MEPQIDLLTNQAIKAALTGNWERAIGINLQILAEDKDNVETLNRLARAYREVGKIGKARETYQRTLKIDKLNTIAKRGLLRLNMIATKEKNSDMGKGLGKGFLEEAGKTKVIQLLYPADEKILAALDSGDRVKIMVGKHRICIHDQQGRYLGRLSDDLAARLVKLVSAGNTYEVLVKSIEEKQIKVFIRELSRGERVANLPSFPVGEKIDYVAFTPPDLVHKDKPNVRTTEEDGEAPDENEEVGLNEDEELTDVI